MSWIASFHSLFTTVGAAVTFYIVLRVTLAVWNYFRVFVLARRFPSEYGINLRSLGSWAVVTGASDGIGKAYAIELATVHRLNVVLISRSIDRLEKVAREIESLTDGVKTKCIAVDFTGELDIYDKIENELYGLDIAILMNNVGAAGSVDDLVHYHETKRSRTFADIIRVNCFAVTFMTQIVLPGMVAKKKGVIVNMASGAGKCGLMFAPVYSGTKAYVIQFSRLLEAEYIGTGVIFQTLAPFSVATKLIKRSPSLIVCDTKTYAKSAIASIGIESETSGCVQHKFITLVVELLGHLPVAMFRPVLMIFPNRLKQAHQPNKVTTTQNGRNNTTPGDVDRSTSTVRH